MSERCPECGRAIIFGERRFDHGGGVVSHLDCLPDPDIWREASLAFFRGVSPEAEAVTARFWDELAAAKAAAGGEDGGGNA